MTSTMKRFTSYCSQLIASLCLAYIPDVVTVLFPKPPLKYTFSPAIDVYEFSVVLMPERGRGVHIVWLYGDVVLEALFVVETGYCIGFCTGGKNRNCAASWPSDNGVLMLCVITLESHGMPLRPRPRTQEAASRSMLPISLVPWPSRGFIICKGWTVAWYFYFNASQSYMRIAEENNSFKLHNLRQKLLISCFGYLPQ